jgi:uncharacterized protein
MEMPERVAVMTLSGVTLFPQAMLPLRIFEPRYREMLAEVLQTGRLFSVAMQRPGRVRECPCQVAGLGYVRVAVDHADGTSHLILQGLARVELGKVMQRKPYRIHAVRPLPAKADDSVQVDALVAKVHELVKVRLEANPATFSFSAANSACDCHNPDGHKLARDFSVPEVLSYLRRVPEAEQLADLIASALLPNPNERQRILEAVALPARLQLLIHFLMAEISGQQKNSPV